MTTTGMKQITTIAVLSLIAFVTACDSSDMPIQHADSYEYITFSAQSRKLVTRTNPYEAYDPQRHPATMGTFGFYDIALYDALTKARTAPAASNPIFNNEMASYNASTRSWTTLSKKRWDDYSSATSFDFFAYMPHTDGATLKRVATDTYTLSFPFAMSDGGSTPTTSPLIVDPKAAPIICALPNNKKGITDNDENRLVDLKFDQTLTAYRLLFKLDTKMNAIRRFRIKRVTLSGTLATSCTISRTYVWNKTSQRWNAGNIKWTNISRQSFTESPIDIAYSGFNTAAYDDDSRTVLVTSDLYTQWGVDFYTIPDALFQPTISVTYDVELVAEDGTTVVTRKEVTSDITLNKKNFSNLTTGGTAMINPICILIQPRYLYVLADQDAYTGHLLID